MFVHPTNNHIRVLKAPCQQAQADFVHFTCQHTNCWRNAMSHLGPEIPSPVPVWPGQPRDMLHQQPCTASVPQLSWGHSLTEPHAHTVPGSWGSWECATCCKGITSNPVRGLGKNLSRVLASDEVRAVKSREQAENDSSCVSYPEDAVSHPADIPT